jgi:hypothetical protein
MSIIDTYLNSSTKKHSVIAKKSFLNTFFDKIIVINLRRSLSRLIRVTKQLDSYGVIYEIFNAVDGKDNVIAQQHQIYLETPTDPLLQHPLEKKKGCKLLKRPGEYAYLLTWIKLLKRAQEEKWKSLLVFEDDVILCDDFEGKTRDWLSNLAKAKLWLLGATQLPRLRQPIKYDKQCLTGWCRPDQTDGSFAVGFTNDIIKPLLTEVEALCAPFDSGPLRSIYSNPKFRNSCYMAYPHLVIADVGNSTIRESRDLEKIAGTLEWDLSLFTDALQKRRAKLKIFLCLYGKYDDIVNKLENLVTDQDVVWQILVIYSTSISSFPRLSTLKLPKGVKSINIYPRVMVSEWQAKQIGDSESQLSKHDKYFFYPVALNLHSDLLCSLSYL